MQLPPLQRVAHVAPTPHWILQLPPEQSKDTSAPSPTSSLQLPPSHEPEQRVLASQSSLQLPERQLSAPVCAALSLGCSLLPGCTEPPIEADAEAVQPIIDVSHRIPTPTNATDDPT